VEFVCIAIIADILGDDVATIRKHYKKWTPEYQARQDAATQKIQGTELAQTQIGAKPC
jgi:hypothetical protein